MLNDEIIEKVELIDLKGTELYRYKDVEYMNFIDDINLIKEKLLYLKEVMNSRISTDERKKICNFTNGKFHFGLSDESRNYWNISKIRNLKMKYLI